MFFESLRFSLLKYPGMIRGRQKSWSWRQSALFVNWKPRSILVVHCIFQIYHIFKNVSHSFRTEVGNPLTSTPVVLWKNNSQQGSVYLIERKFPELGYNFIKRQAHYDWRTKDTLEYILYGVQLNEHLLVTVTVTITANDILEVNWNTRLQEIRSEWFE